MLATIRKFFGAIGSGLLILLITLVLLEVVLRLFNTLPVHRNPLSGFHSPDPTLGWIGTPNYRGRFNGHDFDVIVEHNELGLRRSAQDRPAANSDAETIVFLGDSFTWGWGVENDEVFTEQLQNKMGKTAKIYNFGVNAYGTAQELLIFDKYARLTQPDTVVVMFFSNDLNDNADDKEGRRPWFERVDGNLIPRNQPVENPSVSAFKLLGQKSVALAVIKYAFHQISDAMAPEAGNKPAPESSQASYAEEKWQLMNALLLKLQSRCAESTPACELRVAYIPWREEVIDFAAQGSSATAKRVGDISAAAGIPFLDLTPGLYEAWQASSDKGQYATPIYLPVNGHWGPAGHAAAARLIFDEWREYAAGAALNDAPAGSTSEATSRPAVPFRFSPRNRAASRHD